MSRGAVVREFRQKLSAALDGGHFDGGPGAARVPMASELSGPPAVDRVSVHHAGAPCPAGSLAADPERFDSEGGFVEATFTCTREVALGALRDAPADHSPPELVDTTLSDPSELRTGVARWIAEADRAALATLRNAAVSWVVDARALAARNGDPQWQSPGALVFGAPGRGVQLAATVDALRSSGSSTHLFLMRSRAGAGDRRVAARLALVWALTRGVVVTSVVLGVRESMQRCSFPVDEALLGDAVGDAVCDIRWAQRPSLAPVVPGPQCRYCHRLTECPQGAAQVAAGRRYPFPPEPVRSPEPTT